MNPRRRAGLLVPPLIFLLATAALAEIPTITHGDAVRLESHLEPGKLVLFDFYADWCGPCRQLAPRIDELARSNDAKLAVRKVDIVNWGSDVANQYGIRYIPQLKLYGPDGKLLAEGDAGRVLSELDRFLADPAAIGAAQPIVGVAGRRSGGSPVAAVVVILGLLGTALLLVLAQRRGGATVAVLPHGGAPPLPPPPAPAERSWFVRADVGIDGPYDAAELERLRDAGLIAPTALVRRRGESDWRPLGEGPIAG